MPKVTHLNEGAENSSEDKEKNTSSPLKKTALIVVDYEKKEQVKLEKNKRKFVCIELNSRKNILVTKKYDNHEFLSAINAKREIYLAFYVKASEQSNCYIEVKKMLERLVDLDISPKSIEQHTLNAIDTVKKHFKGHWENYNDTYENYLDLSNAYDKNTGQPINNVVTDLAKIYSEIEAKYNKNKLIYGDRAIKLEEILTAMKKKYEQNRDKYRHLDSNTVSPVVAAFDLYVSQFNKEMDRLKQEDVNTLLKSKCSALKNEVDNLYVECINAIPKNTLCTEELLNKKSEISKEIELLSQMLKGLQSPVPTEQEINGLQIKYESFVRQVDSLKEEIQELLRPIEKNTQNIVDEKDCQMKSAMLETYFEKIVPALKAIEDHKGVTKSTDKKAILETIITDVNQLQGEIAGSVKEAIQAKAKSIVSYIDENYLNLATARGFFATTGTSGNLVASLKLILNNMFLLQEPSSELTAVAQPRP